MPEEIASLLAVITALPRCRVCFGYAHGTSDDGDAYCRPCCDSFHGVLYAYPWADALLQLPEKYQRP